MIRTVYKALEETNTLGLLNESYDPAKMDIDDKDPDDKPLNDALQTLIERARTDPLTTIAKCGTNDNEDKK